MIGRPQRGFTLVELIMVMVVAGVLGASLLVFLKPAVDAYFDSQRRAGLSDAADTALRRMGRDIRTAVPNSIRAPNEQCFDLVPALGGGRARIDVSEDGAARVLDPAQSVDQFDVLTPLGTPPAAGDWLVLGNLSPDQVHSGENRARITAAGTPANPEHGRHRITLDVAKSFPPGYQDGRFLIVPDAEQVVRYACANAGLDSTGTGTGTLYRHTAGFATAAPVACPDPGGAAVVAEKLSACRFVYDPNKGATQQSGFLWLYLEIAEAGERIALAHGVHVDNTP